MPARTTEENPKMIAKSAVSEDDEGYDEDSDEDSKRDPQPHHGCPRHRPGFEDVMTVMAFE
jgi:hypothetical protein